MIIDPETDAPKLHTNWHRLLLVGYIVIGSTFGGLGAWAAVARLDSAVIAQGVVAVESNKKTLQHLEGGIVSEILVHNGDKVKQGDVLIRLDPTIPKAQLGMYRGELAIALAAEARLIAQRDSLEEIVFPPEVMDLQNDQLVANAIADQRRQFEATHASFEREAAVANAQIAEVEKEISGYQQAADTAKAQLVYAAKELDSLHALYQKQLTDYPRLADAEKEQLQLNGQIAQATISEAQAAQKINEVKLTLEHDRQANREEASKELVDVRKQIGDLRQQITISSDALHRIEIRAPTDGTVQEMHVFTIGGVVRAGDPILDIVPSSDNLVVQAKISPINIDSVAAGMDAEVRFPNFDANTVPYIGGTVHSVSRDKIDDPTVPDGSYFAAEIRVDKKSIPANLQGKLTSGMPAEVFIRTGERTALNYMLGPVLERFYTSFREK